LNIKDGVLAGAVTTSGTVLASQTINSTGAANTIGNLELGAATTALTVNATTALTTGAVDNTTAAALTTLTVTGAGAVSLSATALEATVATIDASAHTGGLTVALGSLVTQTVTGGTGNDLITSGAILTTGSVNAGAGTDTLILGSNVAHANTTALGAKYTNFETVRVNGTLDASKIAGITTVELSGATNSISGMNATQAASVVARVDIGATTLALATATGTSDVLSLTMGTGLTTSEATDTGALTVTGFETLNVATNNGASATAADKNTTIASFSADKLTAINLTGTAVTLSNLATTLAVTIDGTALTGDGATTSVGLTVAGSAVAGSTIKGSAVKDSFTIGAEGSTYNGNSGTDLFITTTALLAADGTTDLVLSGGAGDDTLQLTTFSAVTDLQFTNVTGMDTLVLDTVTTSTTAVGAVLGTNAKTAFADGVTVTSGTLADDAAYSFTSGLYDKGVDVTLVSSGKADDATDGIVVTTKAGDDTVSITASSWVGRAISATSTIAVSTGAGVDTISVTTGTAITDAVTANQKVITAGTGADVITLSGVNHTTGESYFQLVVAAGDSTQTAYDKVTGFDIATATLISDALDFDAAVVTGAVAAAAVTGYTASELTIALTATTGLAVFAGTSAAAITVADALTSISQVITDGKTAIWNDGTDTYVFNADASGDSIVELVGVVGTALLAVETSTAGGVSFM